MSRAAAHRQPQDHRAELMQAFRVGDEDLAANRTGWLSPRQSRRLRRSGYVNLLLAALAAAVLLVGLLTVAERPLRPVQVILTAALVAGLVTLGAVTCYRSSAAAATGRVDCLAGPVLVRMRGRAGWYLTVADRSFKLPVQPWHVLNGAPYRVYVTPGAARIVTMEPDGWS